MNSTTTPRWTAAMIEAYHRGIDDGDCGYPFDDSWTPHKSCYEQGYLSAKAVA